MMFSFYYIFSGHDSWINTSKNLLQVKMAASDWKFYDNHRKYTPDGYCSPSFDSLLKTVMASIIKCLHNIFINTYFITSLKYYWSQLSQSKKGKERLNRPRN